MAYTVLQLLSYAHEKYEKHKRPYTQVGMDRLQQIGALTDHFPPHDCSLLFQPDEIRDELREVIASAGEQGAGKENLPIETRKRNRENAYSQKANGGVAPSRQNNVVYPMNTNDVNEGDGSAIASHSAASPTAAPTEVKRHKEENKSEDHTRCRFLRHYLNLHWASFTNMFRRQPIDHIREYFGESIAWYFAWAGKILLSLYCIVYTVQY